MAFGRLMREALTGDLVKPGPAIAGVESSSTHLRQRRNANLHILLLLAVVLAPLVLYHANTGQYLPAIAGVLLSAVFAVNLVFIALGRPAFLSPAMVLLVTIPLVVLSVIYGQDYSLFWIYPLLVAIPSVLSTGAALWLGIACLVVVIPLIFDSFDASFAVIIALSMIHTLLVSWWLMRVVNQQSEHFLDLVIHDPLTGAKNRRHFQSEIKNAFSLWQRHGRFCTLLLLDVDYFKLINDELGHTAGDAALKSLVKVVQDRIRGVDTVCRYGGEEFAVLLPETDATRAKLLANDLRKRVQDTQIVPDRTMTISIGACDVSSAESPEDWIRLADEALYRAKSNGRNRVELVPSAVEITESIGETLPIWR